MYVKIGRFRKVTVDGKVFYKAPMELDKDSADFFFMMGLRMLIKKKKAKVVVVPIDEAKRLGIKAEKSVEYSDAEYNYFVSEAVNEVLKQAVKNKWKVK